MAVFNRKCGVDVQELSPKEVLDKFPLCETSDVVAGFYVADNGRVVLFLMFFMKLSRF